ncbi:hypothetical protein HD806DRAFT_525932 [Xylariaceae sp. AK1471]|nr:hypothetical protein HD806DRAFT_525932 [Xylariaceae sp. AK1471]
MSRRLAEMILEDEEYINKRKYLRSFFLSHGEEWESFDPESYPTIAREPWDTYRAMAYNATHPSEEQKIDDEEHFDASKLFIKHVSAVPTHLHLLITRLFDLGVVTWKQGSYSEVTFSSKEGLYRLGTDKFDALIAMIGRQVPTPMEFMIKLYEHSLPTCEDFQRQVEKFRAPFEQLVHFLHTAELLERTSLDGREFTARMRQVTGLNLNKGTADQIRFVDDETKRDHERSQPVASRFAPVDLSRFEAMFPDFSLTQLHSMKKTLDRESFGESGQIQKVIVTQ